MRTRASKRKSHRRGRKAVVVAAVAVGTLLAGALVVGVWPGNSVSPAGKTSASGAPAGNGGNRSGDSGTVAPGVAETEAGATFADVARGAAFDAATSVRRVFNPEAGDGPIVTYGEIAAADAAARVKPAPGHATEKRSADETLPTIKFTADAEIIDTSDELIEGFGYLARAMRSSDSEVATEITMTTDACLLSWAKKTLPTLHGAGKASTWTVCGRTAAVIAGGYSTSGSDLLLHAQYGADKARLGAVLLGARALDYASVATDDGEAILIVVARPADRSSDN